MRKNTDLEQFLYDAWNSARERSERYHDITGDVIAESGVPEDGEYYERLAELEWAHSVDILEIIYDFEKERAS